LDEGMFAVKPMNKRIDHVPGLCLFQYLR